MDLNIVKELEYVGNFIKKILELYKKEKCTAREIEIMLYIYENPDQTNSEIHKGTGLLETVTSKYVKNLSTSNLVEKSNGISATEELVKLLDEARNQEEHEYKVKITLSQIAVFIRKFREIYDEQKCIAREILLMIYLYNNQNQFINQIVKSTKIYQSAVSKYIIKWENLKIVVKENNKVSTTKKLNNLLEIVMSEALNSK